MPYEQSSTIVGPSCQGQAENTHQITAVTASAAVGESQSLPVEEWRPVPGFEGLYECSSLGRIKSLGRRDRFNKQFKERILKPIPVNGYYRVSIYDKLCKVHCVRIGRMVATVFIRAPRHGEEVNHIDLNRRNDCASNLEWVTRSENSIHYFANREKPDPDYKVRRFTTQQLIEMRAKWFEGHSTASIGRMFGCDQGHAYRLVKNKMWCIEYPPKPATNILTTVATRLLSIPQ